MQIFSSLTDLFQDENIIEIFINADQSIFLDTTTEKKYWGKIDLDELRTSVKIIAHNNNVVINTIIPTMKGTITDYNARIQILHPPIVSEICASIRFPSKTVIPLIEYKNKNVITSRQYEYLCNAVQEKKSMIIAGSTGSGKTTLVNAMLNELNDTQERIYIIEDTVELASGAKNKVQVLCDARYSSREAIEDALRMTPTRIMLGEVRNGEAAMELLSAWNTGHEGGITSLHAKSASAVGDRLVQLGLQINKHITTDFIIDTIDIIVFIKKVSQQRIVEDVLELQGINENKQIETKNI